MNITFYTDNVDPRIPEMQKKVFETLGHHIRQIQPDIWEGHGGSIDTWLKNYVPDPKTPGSEIIILWDIDCIPLNREIIGAAHASARKGQIMGVAQKASHISNSIIYAGPAFMAFSLDTWKALGSPTFSCTERSDCGGEMTHIAREKGVEVRLLYPINVIEPLWELDGDIRFGRGTTFGMNDIYHAFYSRKGNEKMFLDKCDEVLKRHDKQAD